MVFCKIPYIMSSRVYSKGGEFMSNRIKIYTMELRDNN